MKIGYIYPRLTKQKRMIEPRIQQKFKRSRHNKLSIFKISQEHYELPKGTIWTNGNIYLTRKPKFSRDIQSLYQDKASMLMTLDEFNFLTSTSLNEAPNFKRFKHAPASFKSENRRYFREIVPGRVLEMEDALANETDYLEGDGLKIIIPSKIIDICFRLEELWGLKTIWS